jgi:hypothetical protein
MMDRSCLSNHLARKSTPWLMGYLDGWDATEMVRSGHSVAEYQRASSPDYLHGFGVGVARRAMGSPRPVVAR